MSGAGTGEGCCPCWTLEPDSSWGQHHCRAAAAEEAEPAAPSGLMGRCSEYQREAGQAGSRGGEEPQGHDTDQGERLEQAWS